MTDTNGHGVAKGTFRVKSGHAEMLKGGVIMDVVTAEHARIAEDAGACAVMALERVPADIRVEGGVARMSDPQKICEIQAAVTIPEPAPEPPVVVDAPQLPDPSAQIPEEPPAQSAPPAIADQDDGQEQDHQDKKVSDKSEKNGQNDSDRGDSHKGARD